MNNLFHEMYLNKLLWSDWFCKIRPCRSWFYLNITFLHINWTVFLCYFMHNMYIYIYIQSSLFFILTKSFHISNYCIFSLNIFLLFSFFQTSIWYSSYQFKLSFNAIIHSLLSYVRSAANAANVLEVFGSPLKASQQQF